MLLNEQEQAIITRAMLNAAKATLLVREAGAKDASWSKEDKTPVTIADLASQAILLHEVASIRPKDRVHAEEEAETITDEAKANPVREIIEEVTGASLSLGELRDRISYRGEGTSGADWFIDPIDGTKGYVAGLFYAVACGRAVNGELSEGWMAVPTGDTRMQDITGKLFLSRQGKGVKRFNIATGAEETFTRRDAPKLADGGRLAVIGSRAHDKVAAPEGVDTDKWQVELFPMDSMAKYAALATGAAEVYPRNPSPKFGAQYYWDHAAGALLVAEAGGKITDLEGKPIDWTQGDRMTANEGIFAASSQELHEHFQPIFEAHGMKK
ncbi:hypothetical protein KQI52_03560 [bacterium]|nr:hypothetical protein [bacterium]